MKRCFAILPLLLILGCASAQLLPVEQPSEQAAPPTETGPRVSSEQELLHWALAHSDHQKLRETATQTQQERQQQQQQQQEPESQQEEEEEEYVSAELQAAKVQELSRFVDSQPSETDLIKEVVEILTTDPSLTIEDTIAALEALQTLVEPIDNANNMKVLGAIHPVLVRLESEEPRVRALALHVLGTAASNNPPFQLDAMEAAPDLFPRLLKLLDDTDEVISKALYVLGSMVRNQQPLSHQFLEAGGLAHLETLMVQPHSSGSQAAELRIKRKALSVAMDTLQVDSGFVKHLASSSFPSALVQLLHAPDLDLQEKSLAALRSLLGSGDQGMQQALASQGAGQSLEKLCSHLLTDVKAQEASHAAADDEGTDSHYLKDVMDLCHSALDVMKGKEAPRTEL